MELDEQLRQQFGNRRPFRVPDGYFDKLTADIMSSLPEEQPKAQIRTLGGRRALWAVAASFVGVILFSGFYSYQRQSKEDGAASLAATKSSQSKGDTFDQTADYMMIDSDEMYSLLADL